MKYLILFSLFFINSQTTMCQAKQENFVDKTKWLAGSWKGTFNGAPFYEAWRVYNNSVMVNFTIEIKNGDTSVKENDAIRISGDKIVYGKKGDWLLKRLMPNEIVLENDTARYSNRIIFFHLSNDHWFTLLENPGSTIYYDMERVAALDPVVDRYIARARKNE